VKYAPAVVPTIIPNIAGWGQTQVDCALNAAGSSMAQVGMKSLWARPFSIKVWHCLGDGASLAGWCEGQSPRLCLY
jgi:AGZA family xanthine/uracil permease-like MFS transporter